MNIDDLLRIATERRASDLHLKVGNYPHLRIDGELAPLTEQPRVSAEDMLNMAFSMMSARQKQKFKETTEIDMAYGVAGLGRFRVNIFQQRGNVGLVLRVIPTKIRALDELFLPKVVEQICEMPRGLVLVTGVTGSGKSTTLAAMVDRVNSTRAEHIITIEDPIEFLHRDKKGYVNQREIGVDTPSFSAALRASLRQDPDVILVGEMRDLETIQTALHAAETGHMVFSTLHTLDAVETINRVISIFPPPEQKQIRMQLAAVLRAAYHSRYAPEFIASLPLAGIDGTLRSRMQSVQPGSARLKTGHIDGVSGIAGYVTGASGKVYVVVSLVNDAQFGAGVGDSVHAALVGWTLAAL